MMENYLYCRFLLHRMLKFLRFQIICLNYLVNDSTIANRLVEVPMMNANKPKTPISPFFTIIIVLALPVFSFMNTSVSMRAGNARPSVDKHKAPNKLIDKK